MATFSKFDMSSGSPDRPLYANGQRGSNLAVSIDRSVSFRESMENPILSSLPNMSRSSSCVTQGDAVNFFQCLRFDPKVVAADHKSSRQENLKRHINVALGSVDDSPSVSLKGKLVPSPIPEEIKRIRTGLRESIVKARERMKIFNEALSVFNKFFPSIPSKKRSRSDVFSNDRTNAMISSDRSVLGPNLGKMGLQNHAISSFEPDQQKPEERAKSVVPKKRTRTSLMDVRMDARSSTIVRTSSVVDGERDMARLPNGAVQGDDRGLSIAVDGWEKSKMRKKRSGLRPDLSPTLVLAKSTDGYREPKQGMQQRPVTDVRLKSNNDSHGFRPGAANGAMGIGKSDGVSQQTGLVMRSSAPRTDTADNGSLPSERRDRSIGSDKERVNLRAVNRTNIRDSPNLDSTMSSTKMNASVRGPRSGSGIAPKLPSVAHRATAPAPSDWELSHCTNKSAAVVGVNNRKRTSSAQSSSPPVTHWAGQRPQKISRTARRTNLVPIVSNNDETSALHAVSDATGHEVGLGFARHLTGSSPKQIKIKGEPMSSTALSESEESGAPEIKSKERCKKSDEIEEKAGQNVQKMSNLILPTRKNKLLTGEDPGDNIQRQGRRGRGFTSTRSLVPASAEKLGNVGTAKQLRSARLGFEKSDSKTGRPPTRKLTDRKAYKRNKHMAVSTTADFIDDGHEELLAAANAVIDPAHALSSLLWRQMEPFFGVISDIDIASLEQQESFETMAATASNPSGVDAINIVANGNGLIDSDGEVGLAGETRDITLCQRLISAIISEEDYTSGNDDLEFDDYGSENDLDGEWQEKGLNLPDNIQFTGYAPFKGYRMPGEREHGQPKVNKLDTPSMGINSNFGHPPNGQLLDQAPMPGIAYHELQYDNMNMNEKLYLELQSIGICPEIIPDRGQTRTEGISLDISKLEDEYHGWISTKKILLNGLIKSASETKELQEKEFEGHAHDKLVTMAYQKYMTCWGPNATGGKNSSKMAKQSALAFVKRTLEQCHKFEDTGKSCFSEPLFKDILLSRPSQLNSSPSVNTPTDGESAKPFTNTSSCSLEGRVSASMLSQPANLVSWLSQNGNSYIDSSDMLPLVNQLPEQTSVKEEVWSNRVKKREILLDDVIGGTSSSAPSGIATSLSGSTKGKRSERDREGKGHSKEVLSRNGNNKIGRPALSNVKGERKSKTKPKQKTTQPSVSVNGLVGKISEQPKPTLLSESKSSEMTTNAKEKNGFGLDSLDEAIDLSHLQLPGMDVLGAPDDFDGQEQDLGSWLNIDDDGLQDHDFMGLEIPMDDLSDLNMMV